MAWPTDAARWGRSLAVALVLAFSAPFVGAGDSGAAGLVQYYDVSVSEMRLLDQETGEIELSWTVSAGLPLPANATSSFTGYRVRVRASENADWTEECASARCRGADIAEETADEE